MRKSSTASERHSEVVTLPTRRSSLGTGRLPASSPRRTVTMSPSPICTKSSEPPTTEATRSVAPYATKGSVPSASLPARSSSFARNGRSSRSDSTALRHRSTMVEGNVDAASVRSRSRSCTTSTPGANERTLSIAAFTASCAPTSERKLRAPVTVGDRNDRRIAFARDHEQGVLVRSSRPAMGVTPDRGARRVPAGLPLPRDVADRLGFSGKAVSGAPMRCGLEMGLITSMPIAPSA